MAALIRAFPMHRGGLQLLVLSGSYLTNWVSLFLYQIGEQASPLVLPFLVLLVHLNRSVLQSNINQPAMGFIILAVLVSVILFVYVKARRQFSYFKKHGIPGPVEIPFIGYFGMQFFKKKHMNHFLKSLYNDYKDAKYIGCHRFLDPILIVQDTELIKSVLVKNFDNFADRKVLINEDNDPLIGKNLSTQNGERWRELRAMLSPSFTSSKMRTMFVLMSNCAKNFANRFSELYKDSDAIDMKDAFCKYTIDVIASCAFGIEVDSLKDPNNEFYVHGKKSLIVENLTRLKFILLLAFPSLSTKVGIKFTNKETANFFINVIKDTVKVREEKGIVRPDMLQLMMEAREKTNLNLIEMTSQAFVFFLAGFESVSNQLSITIYELAVRPHIQQKLQKEIDDLMRKTNGNPNYETINDLPYLDALISETLRIHPLANLTRICSKEFEFPPSLPGGKPYVVKPGMEIWIPVPAIHSDPNYFEEPDEFNPERFLNDSSKKSVLSDITSLGFGLGPRMCIANRFAILEIKVLLVHLLSKCTFEPCKKTCIPLEYDYKQFQPAIKGGNWLKIQQRETEL